MGLSGVWVVLGAARTIRKLAQNATDDYLMGLGLEMDGAGGWGLWFLWPTVVGELGEPDGDLLLPWHAVNNDFEKGD